MRHLNCAVFNATSSACVLILYLHLETMEYRTRIAFVSNIFIWNIFKLRKGIWGIQIILLSPYCKINYLLRIQLCEIEFLLQKICIDSDLSIGNLIDLVNNFENFCD